MKKSSSLLLIMAFLFLGASTVKAQPYKMSIGGIVGTTEGASFKMFIAPKLALQADLGFKYGSYYYNYAYDYYSGYNWFWTLELNPNLKYQGNIHEWNVGGLQWFAGGGVGLGYVLSKYHYFYDDYNDIRDNNGARGKFGVNAIGGVEFFFKKIPLTTQFDMRPGYGLLFGSGTKSYFDWGCNVSVRYTF